MDNGQSILAARALCQDLFVMAVSGSNPTENIRYAWGKNNYVKLSLSQRKLSGIEVYGDWEDLSTACLRLYSHTITSNTTSSRILPRVESCPLPNQKKEVICGCMGVTRLELHSMIDKGAKDLDSLSKKTGVCSVCGSCRQKVLEILGDSLWIPAVMHKAIEHGELIKSYSILLTNQKLNGFRPGQHINLQVRVKGQWVERPYTLSDRLIEPHHLRITIKREPKGLFTQWLFEEAPEQIVVKITKPQGTFTPNLP